MIQYLCDYCRIPIKDARQTEIIDVEINGQYAGNLAISTSGKNFCLCIECITKILQDHADKQKGKGG